MNIENVSGMLSNKMCQSDLLNTTRINVASAVTDNMIPLIFLGDPVYILNNL